jgi:hypothetical protein
LSEGGDWELQIQRGTNNLESGENENIFYRRSYTIVSSAEAFTAVVKGHGPRSAAEALWIK